MRKDREEAIKLRKLGKSYSEIKSTLKIPKSTLSDWFHKSSWSNKIEKALTEVAKEKNIVRLRLLNKIRGKHLSRIYKEAREEARKEFEVLKLHPLFIAGIAIYWGEGDNSSRHLVRMGNTNPSMIRVFVKFLLKACGVPPGRIRAHVLLYPDLNRKVCEDYWMRCSGLKPENFNKSVVIVGRHKTRRLPYGVCYISHTSTYLKEKMDEWLMLLPRELAKAQYYSRG